MRKKDTVPTLFGAYILYCGLSEQMQQDLLDKELEAILDAG